VSVAVGTLQTPWQYAEELLAAAGTSLAATTGGTIERTHVDLDVPSLDCEMLVVVIGGTTTRTIRGTELGAAHAYRQGWLNIVTYRILVVRECIPVVSDDSGSPPTPAQRSAAMKLCTEDMWAIWNAIMAAMAEGELFSGACS
jgi:hypothetical protein